MSNDINKTVTTKLFRAGRAAAIFSALLVSVTSCKNCNIVPCDPANPGCIPVLGDVSGVVNTINTTLANVQTSGDTWIATLNALVSNLQNQGFMTAATFVRDTLQNGIARVGVEFRCNVDFTTTRIKQGLRALVDAITSANKDASPNMSNVQPFVCSATPDRISWQEAPQLINFHGFDFGSTDMRLVLVATDGQEMDITNTLTRSSPYQMALNLSGAGAGFPRSCSKISLRFRGTAVSEVACVTNCPAAPPPIVVRAARMTLTNETQKCTDSVLTGCRFDRDTGAACPNGYFRKELQISKVGGSNNGNDGHCGEGDVNSTSAFGSHWQSPSASDCAIHEHMGLNGGFQHFVSCRFVVIAERPEQRIPQPKPVVGWCR